MESDFRFSCRVIPGLEDCTIYVTDVTRSNDEYRLHLTGPLIAASFLIALLASGFQDVLLMQEHLTSGSATRRNT